MNKLVSIAIKLLAIVAGIWSAFASYPTLNKHLIVLLAFVAAVAVGILVGAAVYWVLNWIFTEVSGRPQA